MSSRLKVLTIGCLPMVMAMTVSGAAKAQTAGDEPVEGAQPAASLEASEPFADTKVGKTLQAIWVAEPPLVDGDLSDPVWSLAPEATGFTQWEPDNMAPATEQTSVRIVYDDRNVYVAIRCFDSAPDQILSGLGRRDESLRTDVVAVGLNPQHDHQTAYIFQVNPSNVQLDVYRFDDDIGIDLDYNAVWDSQVRIDQSGWTVELRIPFSQMRFNAAPTAGQVWGFDVRRVLQRRGEVSQWLGRERGGQGVVSRMGHVVFDRPLASARRVELQPYIRLGQEWVPRPSGNASTVVAGADMRVGLGTTTTLSMALNPDFGQVEQDPSVLNLSVFETFYPEKRTFFLEDSRTFVPPYQLFQAFHSRRIGAVPDVVLGDDAGTLDRRMPTTIVGAVKVTGRSDRVTYGVLSALTQAEHARIADAAASGGVRRVAIEPMASYNVARLQRDVGDSSNIGVIATAVLRDGRPGAVTGGIDYNLRWDENRLGLNGHWLGTRVSGVDGAEGGFGGLTALSVVRKHLSANVTIDHLSEAFDVSDMGFLRSRPDRTATHLEAGVMQPDPWSVLRQFSASVVVERAANGDGLAFERTIGLDATADSLGFWRFSIAAERRFEAFDDLDTRGGPPILTPSGSDVSVSVRTDSRRTWNLQLEAGGARDHGGSHERRYRSTLSFQSSNALVTSIQLAYVAGHDSAQWIANLDADGDGLVDHVYGELDRHVVDLSVRSTFSLTRDLTLQMFLQPFVAVGDFANIRKLARPLSFDFEPVDIGLEPDFNRKELVGNVVLRWEYRRGSTLYLVWNTTRTNLSRAGRFRPGADLTDAFRGDGPNVVMVKASHLFSF